MHTHRLLVSAALVVLTIAAGSAAVAQSTSPNPTTPNPSPTVSSTADQVKDWTLKKWNAMKREWREDKVKWDTCNRQASDQKLKSRASWTFIYDCMKSS